MKNKYTILVILFVPATLFFMTEMLILFPLKGSNYFVRAVVHARAGDVTCLIAGDSHPASGFRDVLKECDNLAIGGTSIWMINDLVRSVRKTNKLEKVMISIAPHNFSLYRVENTSPAFSGIAEWFTPAPNLLSRNEVVFGLLLEWIKGAKTAFSGAAFDTSAESLHVAPERVEQHRPLEHFSTSDMAMLYIDMVHSLVEDGVKVCIIHTPVIREYERLLTPAYDRKEWNNLLRQIEEAGARFVSYKDVMKSYPDDMFLNPEHLNQHGAEIFAPKAYESCFGSK